MNKCDRKRQDERKCIVRALVNRKQSQYGENVKMKGIDRGRIKTTK